ncbi:MAG: GIY-YIG nuclease family protein [Asgard group archaeon]|nr:GIY-YIG nuclease family protein [Asgard group archaeon]
MVTCADGTIYTGYTKDLQKRIEQHNKGKQGARYTRNRRPVKISYVDICEAQKEAMKREKQLKKLTREQKLNLINDYKRKQFKIEE